MKPSEHVVKAIDVKKLSTQSLIPNPHNPRMLFDRADLKSLQDSIDMVGILVPLVVYKEKDTGRFIILDGQRRWMCAQELKLPTVPVNEVAEPGLVQNIVTMFQIHKLRKDWELMPTALKVEVLIRELGDKNDDHLAALTGLDVAVVQRCKKLLSYNKHYQDMMLEPNPEDRVKADFFIELYPVRNDREVNKFSWFKRDQFTDDMLKKVKAKGIKSVTDFRVVKQYINNAVKAKKTAAISGRLEQFAKNPELPPEHLNIESAKVVAEAKKLRVSVDKLYAQLSEIDVEDFYGQNDLWDKLHSLSILIRTKLRELGRRENES
jgi:ParB family transcriptional regulator, chromosome partitioning protein